MEPHGSNPKQIVVAVIPARFASTRLPGKLLLELGGRPMILRTVEQTSKAELIDRVIVATDDIRILQVVHDAGFEAIMTAPGHRSGSDRVAEVAAGLPKGTIVVNVQGDEPLISPDTIDRAIDALLQDPDADIATTCEPVMSISELLNGNVVKVVSGAGNYALYFSRSPIPYPRDAAQRHNGDIDAAIRNEPALMSIFRKHTGLYAYRREYLLKFTSLPESGLEKIEMLEQLRALEDGAKIKVVESGGRSIGVDTEEDLAEARRRLRVGGTAIDYAKLT